MGAPDSFSGLGAAVLDAIPLSLYVVDRELRVVAWNRGREQGPLGRPREKAIGRPLKAILAPRGFRAARPVLEEVLRTGRPHESTLESRRGRLVHVRRLPVFDGARVSHVLCTFEDVTERRALEMRLIASDRLAFLGQQVAGVVHEISNPLAAISGCAETLAAIASRAPDEADRRDAREFGEMVWKEVTRCERLLKSLLGAARHHPSAVADVAATVSAALKLLERHPAFTGVEVVARLPRGLPPASIEPDFLQQVVVALSMNAARAMQGAGKLTLRAAAAGNDITLDVLDTGPGVPEPVRDRIFEPFFTTSPGEGTGLGLPIARSLVRGRGGELLHRPRRGKGAWFRVLLKAHAA
ncbi:MAG TPA: ATP-binding protein [Vicinamibacteria bacterium]|nr:ATP-binding protein [Vicinamibacteria bacterium]